MQLYTHIWTAGQINKCICQRAEEYHRITVRRPTTTRACASDGPAWRRRAASRPEHKPPAVPNAARRSINPYLPAFPTVDHDAIHGCGGHGVGNSRVLEARGGVRVTARQACPCLRGCPCSAGSSTTILAPFSGGASYGRRNRL